MSAVRPVAMSLAVVLIAIQNMSCRRDEAARPERAPLSVRLETIEAKPHVAAEEVVGTVRPKLRSIIEAKISGRVEKMLAVPGQ